MEKIQKIKQLFQKIKEGHRFYEHGDNTYRIRLLTAMDSIFKELESLGVARHFSESLLIWGKEFTDSVVLESKNRVEATIEDAEAIFGAEAKDMTEQEKKVSELASKHGAIAYEVLSEEPPKIKILLKKEDGTQSSETSKLSLRERFSDKNKPQTEKQEILL